MDFERDRELIKEINQLKTKISDLQRERAMLRRNIIVVGDAELRVETDYSYPTGEKYIIKIAVNCYPGCPDKKHRQTIISRTNKKDTLSRLDEIIQDLKKLRVELETRGSEETALAKTIYGKENQ